MHRCFHNKKHDLRPLDADVDYNKAFEELPRKYIDELKKLGKLSGRLSGKYAPVGHARRPFKLLIYETMWCLEIVQHFHTTSKHTEHGATSCEDIPDDHTSDNSVDKNLPPYYGERKYILPSYFHRLTFPGLLSFFSSFFWILACSIGLFSSTRTIIEQPYRADENIYLE